jgi:heat shock protein HtpX
MERRRLILDDRALQARMVLVAVLTPPLVLAALAAAVVLFPPEILVGLGLAVVVGVVLALEAPRETRRGRAVGPSEAPELHAMVDRLCVLADVPRPEIWIEREAHPNSWVVDAPGRPPRLHVTQALLDLLEPEELQAVLAHELSHIANRDALVMTVVAMPGVVLLTGGARAARGWWPAWAGAAVALTIGLLTRIATSALSRYRELAADAGACAITGRPSALASALLKVSGRLELVPRADLRAAAARDAFHLVPVQAQRHGRCAGILARPALARLGATHPSLERRLAAIQAFEHRQHHSRRFLAPDELA